MHAPSPLSFTHPPDLSPEEKVIRDLMTLSSRLFFSARETTLFQKKLNDLHSKYPHIQNSKIYTKLKAGAEALHLSQCIQKTQLDLERRTVERRIAEARQRKKEEEHRTWVLASNARAREREEKAAEAECLECQVVNVERRRYEREESVRRDKELWKDIIEGVEVVGELEELKAADVRSEKPVTEGNAEAGEVVEKGHTGVGGWPEYNWAEQYGFGGADDQASTTMIEGVTDTRYLEPETELQGEETGEDFWEVNEIAKDGSSWMPDPESLLWWDQPVNNASWGSESTSSSCVTKMELPACFRTTEQALQASSSWETGVGEEASNEVRRTEEAITTRLSGQSHTQHGNEDGDLVLVSGEESDSDWSISLQEAQEEEENEDGDFQMVTDPIGEWWI